MPRGDRRARKEIVTELRDIKTSIQKSRQQIASTQKQLERIRIAAPNSGRIHEMQVTTIEGEVPPGGTILQIIPSDLGQTLHARIDPASVDQVFVGQEATLCFPGFNARAPHKLYGKVSNAAASTSLEEVTEASFYRVALTLDAAQFSDVTLLSDIRQICGGVSELDSP